MLAGRLARLSGLQAFCCPALSGICSAFWLSQLSGCCHSLYLRTHASAPVLLIRTKVYRATLLTVERFGESYCLLAEPLSIETLDVIR
jgi:hypothetical protein